MYPAATTEPNSESNPPEEKEVKFAGTVGTAAIPKSESSVLLAVVPVTIKNGDLKLNTYALLDSGSEATLIVSSAAKKINIDGPTEDITLATFHGEDPSIEVKKVQFSIASRDGSSLFETTQSLVVPKINISKQKCHWPSVKKEWPHLADLMLPAVDSSHVNVLIGRDVVGAHDVFEQKRPPKGAAGPEAILIPFGWCVVGPVPSSAFRKGQHPILNVNAIHPRDDNQLAENVSQMWKTESFGILPPSEPVRSQIDKTALALLQSTIRHIGDRYEVGLMWKSDNITLPDNRSSALRQFRALQRRFIKDPSYAEKYDKVISEYISLGHARKTEEDDKGTPGRVWYLHQHGVTSPHKPDKVRVVFNCSARYLNTSLNEVLMKGPDLLTSMVGVLLRFRQHPVPVAGDIEKMYHQVKVPAADQSSLRFFYCKPGSQQIDTYQMTVHVFGAISSPTSCLFALKRTAQDQRETYPIAAAMIDQNTYVDNLLYSAETEEEATRNAHYFKTACLHGGFKVVQWMSTSRQLLATVAPAELSTPFLNLDLDKLPVERTLGVHLDWNSDHFLFKFVSRPVTTMREALREMSSVHDPLGLICVLTISVRILFQDIWRAGLEWDEELPASLRDAWASWAKEMAAVENLRIPRCIRLTVKLKNFELHAFSDASELGFGAGVYGRVTHENGQISIRLLMGKARVSPLRQLSIPRLELQGAVMAARIVSTLKKELTVLISKTTYWTDSQTVLQWLRSTTCRYHAFVAHRVTEILDGADPRQWRHIPGELNTADDASRGIPASSLTANHRWLTGPSFLELTPDLWPADLSVGEPSPSDPEVSPVQWVGVHTIIEPHYLIKLGRKESSFERLKRLVGWYRRFLHNYPDKGQKKLSQTWLTVPELRDAVTLLVKVDQRHYFLRELITLKKSKPVPAASEVCQLSPVLDIHGVMRVGGRLVNGKFSEDSKHPIILHHRSALAKLIVMDLHCQLAHSSADRVINDLRHRYYVLRIGVVVRSVLNRCVRCKRLFSRPQPPLMAALPASRLRSHLPPFHSVGIDYFGPLTVIMFRRQVKRYGVLFTCLTTRANHIEIAHSLDTDSFLMAFWRFANRRGFPSEVFSDNGTNLTAGETVLREGIQRLNSERIGTRLALREIRWHFSPPAAPHFGGVWERIIQSAKSALRIVLEGRTVNDEVLLTAMSCVENLLNGRPLTHVSVEPDAEEALTPNHFVLGRANPTHPADVFEENEKPSAKSWRNGQIIATHFWNRWLREYIPHLIERRKWLKNRRNLQVNDMVLVVDPRNRRGEWPLGRIMETFPAPDGVVRVVRVRTATGEVTRPVTKLCLLETTDSEVSASETGPAM